MDLCSFCSFPLNKALPGLRWHFPPPPPPYLSRTVHLRFQFVPQSKWYHHHTNLGGPADVYCYRWEGPLPGGLFFLTQCCVMNPIFWFWVCTSQQKPGTQTPPWKQKLSTDDTGVNTLEKWVDTLAEQFCVLKTHTWAKWLHKSNDVLNKTAWWT